jgi:hypothetical protein
MAKQKNDELVKVETGGAMAVPSYIKQGDTRGTDHLKKEDLQIPRISLAQGLSPELKRTEAKYIEGLQQGDMFNNLTKEILGEGPIEFTIVRADPPRGIEFYPREEGGGVKDINVPLDDPRMQFGPTGEKPVATKFYDYVILLLPKREVIALSMKSSGLKVARQLNALMKYRQVPVPSFAMKFTLRSVPEKNAKGEYFNFAVANAGYVDEATYKFAEALFETIKDKQLDIEREPDDPEAGDTSFDTDKM